MPKIIEFREACKQFGNSDVYAVDHVTASIEEGTFVTVLGSSGSGKTTLIKMVNRIYEPTGGEILVNGREIHQQQPEQLRREIGYVIQQIGLFPHMTVEQNIGIVPQIMKWEPQRIKERVRELLSLVNLPAEQFAARYPGQLSGGQQQRIGIARAMAANPSIMLMDEPFGAIDAITRCALQDELRSIQRQLNITILFVTHDIGEAFKLGDQVIIMNKGKLEQFDTPQNILFQPSSDYVSHLVDADNLFQKLSMIPAESIAQPAAGENAGNPVKGDANLLEVLQCFLRGGDRVQVLSSDGAACGVITWQRICEYVQTTS